MSTSPKAVVTFLTDFSTRDEYVGAMKGVVLGRCRDAVMVDLSHDVEPGDVTRGAFLLEAAVPHFPPGTVHVAVVDPGVGSARSPLVIDCGDYVLVGPDNGLLSLARSRDARAFVLDRPEFFAPDVSATFHGRDVFAPVAGHLAAGRSANELGSPVEDILTIIPPLVHTDSDGVVGEVLYADRFGNLITNLERTHVESLAAPVSATVSDTHVCPVLVTYSDANKDDLIALVGSTGRIEIAVARGSAARRLGPDSRPGTPVTLRPSAT